MPAYVLAVLRTVTKLEFRRIEAKNALEAACSEGQPFEEHVLTDGNVVVSDQALELPDGTLSVANVITQTDAWKGQLIARYTPKPAPIPRLAPSKKSVGGAYASAQSPRSPFLEQPGIQRGGAHASDLAEVALGLAGVLPAAGSPERRTANRPNTSQPAKKVKKAKKVVAPPLAEEQLVEEQLVPLEEQLVPLVDRVEMEVQKATQQMAQAVAPAQEPEIPPVVSTPVTHNPDVNYAVLIDAPIVSAST